MSNSIKQIIDDIIRERAKGNPAIEEMTKAKLILKGIYPHRYDVNQPEIIKRLNEIRKQFKAEETVEERYYIKTAFSAKETEEDLVSDIQNQLQNEEYRKISEENRELKKEVSELKRKLEFTINELKQFNITLEEEIDQRTKREDRIRYLSYHDELTDLYNRRFYEEAVKKFDNPEYLPISVVIGDINNLKNTNDTLGHDIGDELIRKSANAIKAACRKDDIIVRFGGDEFVVLLPKTSKDMAEKIVKRMEKFASKEFVNNFNVSISFGFDTKENKDEDLLEIFKNAEDLMYVQKARKKELNIHH
jgi:diguanylate cyclase (GGDEF)-like protein